MKTALSALFREIKSTISSSGMSRNERMRKVCELLKDRISHYGWVGFYLTDPDNNRELVLGPYAGDPTDHVRIPFGSGICGQAAEREETFVVQDVSRESNYLSCSINVRSEIVVPIFKDGKVAGEIDIDSHEISPFTDEDRIFLEQVSGAVADIL